MGTSWDPGPGNGDRLGSLLSRRFHTAREGTATGNGTEDEVDTRILNSYYERLLNKYIQKSARESTISK